MADLVRSGKQVAVAALGAAAIAAVILLTLVLPAEYGVDPLGTGEALGLLGLSNQPPETITSAPTAFSVDVISFDLAPFESVEYKYRLDSGASLLFSWEASADTVYDLHAEPDGAEPGYAESFSRGKAAAGNGTYVARFSGIHGWFFENRQPSALTVTLTTAGFYGEATEFRDGWETLHQPQPAMQVLAP